MRKRGRRHRKRPIPVSSGRGGRRGTESTPASVGGCGCRCRCRCDVEQVDQASTHGSRGGSRGRGHSGSHSGSRRDGSSTSVSPGRSVPCAVRVHLSFVLGPDVLLHHRQRRARGFRPGREASLPVRVRAVVTHRLHVHHLFLLPRVQRRGPHERYVHAERADGCPSNSVQMKMPRLTDAQRGWREGQSAHSWFSGRFKHASRRLRSLLCSRSDILR